MSEIKKKIVAHHRDKHPTTDVVSLNVWVENGLKSIYLDQDYDLLAVHDDPLSERILNLATDFDLIWDFVNLHGRGTEMFEGEEDDPQPKMDAMCTACTHDCITLCPNYQNYQVYSYSLTDWEMRQEDV